MSPLQHAVHALGQPGEQPLEAAAPEELLHSLLGEQRLAGQLPLHGFGDVAQEGLHNVRVVHGCEPPRCHPRSGKLSRVVAAG